MTNPRAHGRSDGLESNPYAAPRTAIGESPQNDGDGKIGGQGKRFVFRETVFRIGGILGIILSLVVFVVFGLGFLSEIRRISAVHQGNLDLWVYRRFASRMVSVLSICLVAAATNLGIRRFRHWARWVLTVAAVLPVSGLFFSMLRLFFTVNREPTEVTPGGLAILCVLWALYAVPILFLLWSRIGSAIFAPGYSRATGKNPADRSGCLGVLAACGFVFAEGFAFTAVVLWVDSLMEFLRAPMVLD